MKYLIAIRRAFLVAILLGGLYPLTSLEAQARGKQFKGKDAIAKLGKRLPDVAKKNRLSAKALIKLFEQDSSFHVDESDGLLYIEKAYTKLTETSNSDLSSSSEQSIPPEDAFLLNSKSDSNRTIYLDFNGQVISGTAWNSTLNEDQYNAPAFDLDGLPDSFNTTERQTIINIWKRVAEDFAPFDVNITTQEPSKDAISRSSSSDQTYGTIALITRAFPVCNGTTNCGGVAYYNAFGSTSDYTKPALVFFDKLGNGSEKYTAEAISHELGHNLGLQHDGVTGGASYYSGHGSGETGWAPIMGVGYYQQLSQWSKGEYTNANNLQDDLSAMQTLGLLFRADDHGNDPTKASAINQGSTFGISGIIEQRADVDFFRFNAGIGEVLLEASPATLGANLDINITAYDSNGKVLGQSNPTNTLSASLLFNSPADGTYYVAVEGVGYGDLATGYSDYGSLGKYTLIGSITNPSGNQSPVAIAKSSVLNGDAPLLVTFDGSSSGDQDGTIVSYKWDFGDGASAEGIKVQHTFQAGTYAVTLIVTDNGGISDSDTLSIKVNAPVNQTPKAVASASVTSGIVPLIVNFSSAGSSDNDGRIASYQWAFGDGGTSTLANPSYTYNKAGTFNAKLTVTDNAGDSASALVQVIVSENSNTINAPTNLTSRQSGTYLMLSWTDNSSNEVGFNVYKSYQEITGYGKNKGISDSPWQMIATVEKDRRNYTDYVIKGQTLLYKVEAINANGNTAESNVIKIKIR
jgi:PKD repeat protein